MDMWILLILTMILNDIQKYLRKREERAEEEGFSGEVLGIAELVE